MTLSDATRTALGSLDADAVEDLARRTVAEDLAGGVDVTSTATVPETLMGTAAFVPRAPGVVAGLGVAMACIEVIGPVTWDVVGVDGPAAAGQTCR